MFNNKFYLTKGVAEKLSPTLHFQLIDSIQSFASEEIETDYFLILNYSVDPEFDLQKLEISQERPERKKNYYFESANIITEKLYAIDDNTHSTILFPCEY